MWLCSNKALFTTMDGQPVGHGLLIPVKEERDLNIIFKTWYPMGGTERDNCGLTRELVRYAESQAAH
jgi:hypothetical protein